MEEVVAEQSHAKSWEDTGTQTQFSSNPVELMSETVVFFILRIRACHVPVIARGARV